MISTVVYAESELLADVIRRYVQDNPDMQVVEYTDKLEAAVPAALSIMPELMICEDIETLNVRQLLTSTSGYLTNTYVLVCGTAPDYSCLLDLLRCGIRDCVAVPWGERDIWEALDRFHVQYRANHAVHEDSHAQKLRRVLDKKFFEDTIVTSNGQAILSDFNAINEEYQIAFRPGYFRTLYLLLDPRPREPMYADAFLPVFQLETLARQFFMEASHAVVCYVKDHGLSVLLNTDSGEQDIRALAHDYLKLCRKECKWFTGINTISVGIGLETRDSTCIPLMMQSAKMAGWMRLSEGKGRVLCYRDYFDTYHDKQEFLEHQTETALRSCVEHLDFSGCRNIICDRLQHAENAAVGICEAIDINDVLIDAFNAYGKGKVVQNSKYLQLAQNMPPMVENLESMEMIIAAILEWVEQCMLLLREQSDRQEDHEILTAKQYISANYTGLIRLEDVAAAVNLSGPYFCMKFRQATGRTFVEYLTELRIERAKELLRNTNDRVYEIALAVGFQDSRHFSRTFHKLCGMLPTQYRQTN